MTRDVLNHLRDLAENLDDWRAYLRETPLRAFLRDRGSRHKILHAAIVALQAAIDIANHWVSEIATERPESYRAIADILGREKAIPRTLAEDLKRYFSLRNVLIHKYQGLDLRRLYGDLERAPRPLGRFLKLAKTRTRLKK